MNCEYRINVLETFKKLQHTLLILNEQLLKDDDLPSWFEPLPYPALRGATDRETITRLLKQNTYLDGQEGREILIGVGLIGCRAQTLESAQHLNQAKKDFQYAVKELKAQKLRLTDDWLKEAFIQLFENNRHEFTATALEAAGLSRLHLKQCYRQIPVLSERPYSVSWSWANTRSIKKITKTTAIELLKNKGDDLGIQSQIQLVEALKANESIAIVQDLAPHLRTNIVYERAEVNERVMTKGSLPLLYPAQPGEVLPKIIPPKPVKNAERQKRADTIIDPEVYLPAIRGHRYRY